MKEHDPLNSVLREWEAPDPSSAVDARVRAAYRSAHRPSLWRRIWSAQVTIIRSISKSISKLRQSNAFSALA